MILSVRLKMRFGNAMHCCRSSLHSKLVGWRFLPLIVFNLPGTGPSPNLDEPDSTVGKPNVAYYGFRRQMLSPRGKRHQA